MAKQGCRLQEAEIRTITRLLDTTDMTIGDIAQRIGRSRAAVISVNRRFRLRDYRGQRSTWEVVSGGSEVKQA
jgi:IS30 family transposase